jgi:hypothetical protein
MITYKNGIFKEELREQNKVLRSAQRDIDRDRNQLEREKKRIVCIKLFTFLCLFMSEFSSIFLNLKELEIKKMAKEGNKQVKKTNRNNYYFRILS